ncbi:MAG: hypothetical protein BGO12_09730 [Verrucomicrobia bacterium 61-8]|nr:MAG: hypothetical protein BGO12_09730 [Verrucomicrobia bacterium 61-8]
MCIGEGNALAHDEEWGEGANSLLVGYYNYNTEADSSIIVGDYCQAHSDNTGTIGRGLINYWADATIVGRFNGTASDGLLFAVGSGADSNNRGNVMEVYEDGKVVLPRQGDILMGEFGNPE